MDLDYNYKWEPVKGQIMTRWAKDVTSDNPLPEYPRPQFKRQNWFNLNGLWDYAIRPKNEKNVFQFDGKILVPFPVESALSGVKKKLKSTQKLWYHRNFKIPNSWKDKIILLHFGAVDWETTIWINNQHTGTHRGGFTPFSFDITDFIRIDRENDILISVWDPTDKSNQERGKQTSTTGGIYYTAVSGIWQTVWLEPVPKTFIKSIQLTTNIDEGALTIKLECQNIHSTDIIHIEVYDNNKSIVSFQDGFLHHYKIIIPSATLWSPTNPFLYDLELTLKRDDEIIDEVKSYFGMRKIKLGTKKNGVRQIELNNKQLFQYGTLDQGYWPDGLYTAPTDEASCYDIEITKEFGFNMIRKHVKIEPARWYYHCDKIGILVWQDMPNGGKLELDLTQTYENASTYEREDNEKQTYYNELESMINTLYNSPSIVVWVPFNEGWGQFDTNLVVEKIKELDNTRLIDNASGWFDQGVGDILDNHNYPAPKMPFIEDDEDRAAVIGEFGGLGLEVNNHTWKIASRFVYRNFHEIDKLTEKYEQLISRLKNLIIKGLSAAIYTQITDVEGELNGLITYDRKFIKINKNRLKQINSTLYSL